MSPVPPARTPVAWPAGIEVRYLDAAGRPREEGDGAAARDGGVVLRLRWFGLHHVLLLILCIWWDSILVRVQVPALIGEYYGRAVELMGRPGGLRSLFVLLALLAYGAMCVGVSYYTVAGLLNHTEITATAERLTIRHGPIPWRGRRTIEVRRIRQFRIERVPGPRGGNSYDLHALLVDGPSVGVVHRVSKAHARFLEHVLGSHLDLAPGISPADTDGMG
ncbi:PH domain-containing protein [Chondromyces crocatus]|uniref:DUF304 domain-containing protein n=1 Tax=Chondromyces crocatus TaxID=52 RepID=A0A0K1ESU2_CHOCO|nr:PH domain-containing protein [Chondromyces crocatus]AKT44005.1 uncharacterized protein CMC5_082430 [Chondromyces crocatus]